MLLVPQDEANGICKKYASTNLSTSSRREASSGMGEMRLKTVHFRDQTSIILPALVEMAQVGVLAQRFGGTIKYDAKQHEGCRSSRVRSIYQRTGTKRLGVW